MFATAAIGTEAWAWEAIGVALFFGVMVFCVTIGVLIPLRLFGVIGRKKRPAVSEGRTLPPRIILPSSE